MRACAPNLARSRHRRKQLADELDVIEAPDWPTTFSSSGTSAEARARGIRCQGRGSAANSLVAYLLGITPVDPCRQSAVRTVPQRYHQHDPDIDLDFERDRRDEVIDYVYERYGREHRALVCNVVTYQALGRARRGAGARFPPEELGTSGICTNRGIGRPREEWRMIRQRPRQGNLPIPPSY